MEQKLTTVVNIYRDEFDIYIGRAGKGQSGYWGNPFHGSNRNENIEDFRRYFFNRLKSDPEFKRRLYVLKGKRLGCFCKPEKKCHGDVIAEYLNSLPEEQPLRLAVVGSRTFTDYQFLSQILAWYPIKTIVSGGAIGADSLAARYAQEHKIPLQEFLPDWNRFGKSAGFKRNEQIVDAADEVVAFWDGHSKGTQHTIKLAEDKGLPVAVYWPSSPQNSIPHDEISRL